MDYKAGLELVALFSTIRAGCPCLAQILICSENATSAQQAAAVGKHGLHTEISRGFNTQMS